MIYEALLAAQSEAPGLQKTAINPHFRSKYVSLDSLMSQILPILNKHGLVLVQSPTVLESGEAALRTTIVHAESKTLIEDTMLLNAAKNDPQGHGSAITYARRYSLMALLGLVADEDDDGNAASKRSGGEPSAAQPRGSSQSSRKQAPAEPKQPSPSGKPMFDAPGAKPASEQRKKKLDVLVGTLRDGGHITTEQVYRACQRDPKPNADGRLSWGDLRETLTNDEASSLIDRLVKFEANVKKAAA